jgi:hypothetical protein
MIRLKKKNLIITLLIIPIGIVCLLFCTNIFLQTTFISFDKAIIIPKTNEKIYFINRLGHEILITKTNNKLNNILNLRFSKIYHIIGVDEIFYTINNDSLNIYYNGKLYRVEKEYTKTKIIFHELTNIENYECIEEFKKGKLQMFCLHNVKDLYQKKMKNK